MEQHPFALGTLCIICSLCQSKQSNIYGQYKYDVRKNNNKKQTNMKALILKKKVFLNLFFFFTIIKKGL